MLTLFRTRMTKTETVGVLCHNGIPICFTLELPWKDNHNDQSCIPPGSYPVSRFVSDKHGVTLCIKDVPGRTGILFHCGNKCTDTLGCIIVGKEFAEIPHHGVVIYDSRKAFDLFVPDLVNLTPLAIEVINPYENIGKVR